MKFFICALVVCALSMNAQASVVPLALNAPILYSAAYGPGLSIGNSHPIVGYAPGFPAVSHQLYNSPLVVPSIGLNTEATYIAKTTGSEHIASLPGHFLSTSSINLEQASGINKDKIKDSSALLPSSVAIHGSAIPSVALPLSYSQFIVPAPIAVLPAEATYVAKNLGVEHIAPLPGHIVSTASLNLEPAPGSK